MAKRIVIFGGTGSLGKKLVKFYDLGELAEEVVVYSTDPHKQIALSNEVTKKCVFVLGDIRDFNSVLNTVDGADMVVHTAALKHVNLGESNIQEFLAVNISGSNNVAEACRQKGVKKVVFISSDKAVEPINFYGKTKAIGEDIFLAYGFSVLRYGNVVNSQGSFLDVWLDFARHHKKISIRQPDPTRFYLELDHAVDLVNDVVVTDDNGLFIPARLRSFSVSDVFSSFSEGLKGLGFRVNYEYSELMPGEKQHEVLLAKYENGISFNDNLCKISKTIYGKLDHADFSSETSQRMSNIDIAHFVSRFFDNVIK